VDDAPPPQYRTVAVYAVAEVGADDDPAAAYLALAAVLERCADNAQGRRRPFVPLESSQPVRFFDLVSKPGWVHGAAAVAGEP
jgi:hypothetical protein